METPVTPAPVDAIHYTDASVTVSQQGSSWSDSRTYKNIAAAVSLLRWLAVVGVFIFGVYKYQTTVNAENSSNVADLARETRTLKDTMEQYRQARNEQIAEIKKTTLTIELFNARSDDTERRLARIEAAIERLQTR